MFQKAQYIVYSFLMITLMSCHQKHPNVLLIMTDDLAWGDVGFNGNQMISTPQIDALSEHSIVIDRFYVEPTGASTREELLSGRYPSASLELNTPMPKLFSANSYKTSYFGKWHDENTTPDALGFNSSFMPNYSVNRSYVTDKLTDSLISFMSNESEPFFAMLSYDMPQHINDVTCDYFEKYSALGLTKRTALHYGMMESIDKNIDLILQSLKSNYRFNNTIFIFMSDNGLSHVRYNGGLKGRKGQVDEGGVRVPFILNYPNGGFHPKHIDESFACHLDIYPTLLSLCGIQSKTELDGINLSQTFSNGHFKNKERHYFTSTSGFDKNFDAGAIRTKDYLLTYTEQDTSLYKIVNDPYQMNDVIGAHSEVANQLLTEYKQWQLTVNKE